MQSVFGWGFMLCFVVGLVASSGLIPDEAWNSFPPWLFAALMIAGFFAAIVTIGSFVASVFAKRGKNADHGEHADQ
jgi:ABC-type polysaccharide/polyol phosphate export permease